MKSHQTDTHTQMSCAEENARDGVGEEYACCGGGEENACCGGGEENACCGGGKANTCDDAQLLPLRSEGGRCRFEDASEWKWTKEVCRGLFRALGRYYDELWFPTVLNEWCQLYFQCNHAGHYWQVRDAWLAGDDEVRLAVWSEVLAQRSRRDRQMRDGCADLDESRTEEPARILKMRKTLDEGNDRIVMRKMKPSELACRDKEGPSAEERARAETEAAEIALADPSEDPNWVEMRRRMRGSFAGLNLARCDVNGELLAHMMVELCNYWRNQPPSEHQIDPLLERNIVREIRNFRYRLFGRPPPPPPPPADVDPECTEPEPHRRERSLNARCRRERSPPDVQSRRGSVTAAEARPPAKANRPRSRNCGRGPVTNKLAEARAKLNAARIKALEDKKC